MFFAETTEMEPKKDKKCYNFEEWIQPLELGFQIIGAYLSGLGL